VIPLIIAKFTGSELNPSWQVKQSYWAGSPRPALRSKICWRVSVCLSSICLLNPQIENHLFFLWAGRMWVFLLLETAHKALKRSPCIRKHYSEMQSNWVLMTLCKP
jgi:hypothetical protein